MQRTNVTVHKNKLTFLRYLSVIASTESPDAPLVMLENAEADKSKSKPRDKIQVSFPTFWLKRLSHETQLELEEGLEERLNI